MLEDGKRDHLQELTHAHLEVDPLDMLLRDYSTKNYDKRIAEATLVDENERVNKSRRISY